MILISAEISIIISAIASDSKILHCLKLPIAHQPRFVANGIIWAIDQAMAFYHRPRKFRVSQVQRIMTDSLVRFDPGDTARQTIDLYARALDRSLVHLKAAPDQSDSSQKAASMRPMYPRIPCNLFRDPAECGLRCQNNQIAGEHQCNAYQGVDGPVISFKHGRKYQCDNRHEQ